MFTNNLLLKTDSYKLSHAQQYPPKTQIVASYLEARNGADHDETVFFGLQYLLKRYLVGEVFTAQDIEQAKMVSAQHMGGPGIFNYDGWRRLYHKYGGRLPIRIRAVAEGTPVSTSNVLMTVENTDPEFYWLTNYLETLLLHVWYPSTVATISRAAKKVILRYLEETGDPSLIDWKLHDFGGRGVTGSEAAALGGAAHLVNFRGTDTIPGIALAMDYYGSDVCGDSIPAYEHSTVTSWGRDGEVDCYRNALKQYPGMAAVVSDSYDIDHAIGEIWGRELKDEVMRREAPLIIRPDSGNPVEVAVQDADRLMRERFGSTVNEKGYHVLPPQVRGIQGDGCNLQSIERILRYLKMSGSSADNWAFGMGGALLQKVNRDTQRFAFKCSWAQVDGEGRDVWKDPKTDPSKASKKGRLGLRQTSSGWKTVPQGSPGVEMLEDVFVDGELVREQDFDSIRANAAIV